MAVREGATRSAPASEGLDIVPALHHHSSPAMRLGPLVETGGLASRSCAPAARRWSRGARPQPAAVGGPLKPCPTRADSLNRGAMDLCS
jgi:hypothetical protein